MEDEPDIAALVAYHLTREGFRVETAGTGPEAVAALARDRPDLVVLDRMLPGFSGDEVLRRLRADETTAGVAVLMLTAKVEQEDRIAGLEMGADDYLPKPFSPRELVLRAQAILRRVREPLGGDGPGVLNLGPLRVDAGAHRVSVDGVEATLTATEFRLLYVLLDRRGRTQSREQLLQSVWDVEEEASARLRTRTVDMHVQRLRTKLGGVGDWIETVRGFGYRLTLPEDLD